MDSAYAGPATQAWDAIGDVPQLEALEEYWQEEQGDVEYTALLEEFDFTATAAPAAAPARQRPGMPHPAMPHPSIPRIGRRRGGSKDHRLWIGLGGVVVVAAVAIFGIVKFEFPSAGAAHTFATPAKIAGTCYTNSASIAKSANLGALGQKMAKASGGTDPVSAAYESTCGTTAATATEVLSVIMLHLPNDSPSGSIAAFEREYPNAQVVSAGSMGGQAACEQGGGSSDEAQCVWFDNDSYGTLLSATMNANALSSALLHVRPSVELQAK
jgi:hypothetical protein